MALTRDPEDMAIEDLSKSVAQIYAGVGHNTRPMLRWALILNDATILAEEVRRNREKEALERAGKIFMRLLDFTGYYLYLHKLGADDASFADRLASTLRRTSYEDYLVKPTEGLTRWVLAKYPHVCSKCGGKPCECVLKPWIFENRREDPGPYHDYRSRVEKARRALKSGTIRRFTVPALVQFFNGIYRNGYYSQDSWKLVMHFAEELGEATTELTRLELLDLGKTKTTFDLIARSSKVKAVASQKIKTETARISAPKDKKAFRDMANAKLNEMSDALASEDGWEEVFDWTGDKLKEELSDVFSWLCAVILRFGGKSSEEELARMIIGRYVKDSPEGNELKCPWCGKEECNDDCLIRHGIASELIENVLKF